MDLYINTPGTYVHIKDDMFEVRVPSGNKETPYNKHHFAAHKVRSIIMPRSAAFSTDAVFLALHNNIDILFMENNGSPAGRVWHSKHGSTTKIRKRQLEASLNGEGVFWTKQWIGAKINNQVDLLKDLKKHRSLQGELIDSTVNELLSYKTKVDEITATKIDDIDETLRGWEGTAGRLYFQTLSELIPPKYKFNGRSYRPAKDAFNACLNYCYGILYGKVEKALIIAGIDPYLGFMHRDDYNQKSMVFDFIEPFRAFADEAVFKFFSSKTVRDSFFSPIANGISLNAEGKPVIIETFNQHFDENQVRFKGRNLTRHHIIQLEAHSFANQLIK